MMINNFSINSSYSNLHVSCDQLLWFGYYSIFLLLLSLVFNVLLMIAVFKTKHVREARYYFLACLSILNFIGSITELPITAISAFNCGLEFR